MTTTTPTPVRREDLIDLLKDCLWNLSAPEGGKIPLLAQQLIQTLQQEGVDTDRLLARAASAPHHKGDPDREA